MDWTLMMSIAAFALALITAIAGLMYLIMKLMVHPLKEDLDELKRNTSNLRTDSEITRMIDLAVANHRQECMGNFKKLGLKECPEC